MRRDLALWAGALAAAALGTAVAVAAGARLGAGLTLGLVLLIAIVLAKMGLEAAGREGPARVDDEKGAPVPPSRVPSSARARPVRGTAKAKRRRSR